MHPYIETKIKYLNYLGVYGTSYMVEVLLFKPQSKADKGWSALLTLYFICFCIEPADPFNTQLEL